MYFIVLFTVLALIYLYGTRNHKYWAKRGVKHEKPLPFVGNFSKCLLMRQSHTQFSVELYRKHPNEKFVGFYLGNEPILLVRDPEIIKAIMSTDFYYFHKRGLNIGNTGNEPMLKNLFHADGDIWKLLRQRMTPAFTSGKLKAMFPLIVERAVKMQDLARKAAESGQVLDVRELMARYTTDFIGACGFGVDMNSLDDENSAFRQLGKKIFDVNLKDAIVWIFKQIFPNSPVEVMPKDITNDILHLVQSVMRERNYEPSGRNDFIDLLMILKQKGKLVGESVESRNPDGSAKVVEIEFDDLLIAAQAFIFFAAGFETSSSSTSYTLHELAFHPEEQKRVQEEIDEVLTRYDNKLCYDAIKEMKYLEMAFLEGSRLFPSLGQLNRKCVRKYTLPGTDVTIDESVYIIIPSQALHTDEQYFENPDKFMPERFAPEKIKDIKKFTYLPFGDGPRACIGERLGLMQSLAGLAALLHKYTVEPAPTTPRHPIVDPSGSVVQTVLGGIPLRIKARC